MSIADDIAEVLNELGSPVEVHPPGPLIDDPPIEMLDKEALLDQMSLFPRMHQVNGTLAANTTAMAGSTIKHGNLYYLVTCFAYTEFEGLPIEAGVILYLCAVRGAFSRHSDTPTYDAQYKRTEPWTPIVADIRVCLADKSLMTLTEEHKQHMLEQTYKYVCYVADGVFDIKVGDRLTTTTGATYKVSNINAYLFPGVQVLGMVEDER